MASQTEQIQIAFKHTLDIYGARSDRQWFEETYGAKHVVVASDVWSKTPPYNDPTTGISQGIVTSEIDFVLTLDPFSSNRLWVAKTIPGSWPFLGSLTNWVLLNSQRIKNWVSPTIFGASYVFVLKQNNGTLIPTGNWEWNFSEGLLHLDDGNTVPDKGWLAPLKLTGFRYIGPFVGASTGFGSPVQAITDLRAVSSIERADKQIRLVEDKKAIYAFDTSGLGSDDGDTTIVPGDVIVPAPGRWFRTASAGQDHESLTGLLGGAPNDHVHLSSTLVGYVPTSGEKSALAGTSGTPGPSNKYVTDGDSRNTNSRAPTAHGTNHKEGGGDEVATATSAANAIPKADAGGKLDSWVTANAIAATPSLRKLGTGSTDACAGDDTRLLDEKVKLSAVDPTAGYLEDKITGSGTNSTKLGVGALASAVNSMAVGWGTTASGTSSIAIGVSTSATQLDSSAVGSGANASGLRGSAFGRSAQATFADSTAVGYNAQAVALNSAAFGSGAQALGSSSYALGKGSIASGGNSVAIGSLATTVGSGGDAIAIGVLASSATYASVVIGRLASAGGSGATKVAIGYTAAAGGDGAVAVGQNTIANGDGSVAIGKTASTVAYLNALAIGEGALATANNDGQIGSAIKPINLTGYGDLNWPGGFVHQVGPWEQDNVAAGQSVVALFLTGSVTRTGRVAVRAGSILGVVVRSNEAQTAGTLTVEVTKNGVGVGLTAVLDGINTTVKASTQAKGVDTFVAGDSIGVIITTDGAWAPTTADITVEVLIEE